MRISRIAKLCLFGCLFTHGALAATVTLTVEGVKNGERADSGEPVR